jgi:hypothetical protein
VDNALLLREIQRASKDCKFFIKRFCLTLDEHDSKNPIKKFPDKEYIWDLVDLFLNERLLLVEKSRQMLCTWVMVACHLWWVMFKDGQRVFFQSKKEKDANNLVDRAKFIYDHLPEEMRQLYPCKEPRAYLKFEFPKWHSIIEGTPQGGDILRQYTASRLFSDELAFQEKASEAFISAKPTIDGGGSFVGISSANFKNFFYLLVKDKI